MADDTRSYSQQFRQSRYSTSLSSVLVPTLQLYHFTFAAVVQPFYKFADPLCLKYSIKQLFYISICHQKSILDLIRHETNRGILEDTSSGLHLDSDFPWHR